MLKKSLGYKRLTLLLWLRFRTLGGSYCLKQHVGLQKVSMIWPLFNHALDRYILSLVLNPAHFNKLSFQNLTPGRDVFSVKLVLMLPFKGFLIYPIASQFPGINEYDLQELLHEGNFVS
jgi:hypothetical protein